MRTNIKGEENRRTDRISQLWERKWETGKRLRHFGSNFRNVYQGNRASYVLWNGPKHPRMMRMGSWSPWGQWGWRVGIAAPTTAFPLWMDDNNLCKMEFRRFLCEPWETINEVRFLTKGLECQQRATTFQQEDQRAGLYYGETSLTAEGWSQGQAGGREGIWAHLKDVKG